MTARFEAKDDGFDLLLGDRVILRHRVDVPAFRIARGNPTVTMVRGNFRHEDAPTDERVLRFATVVDPLQLVTLSDSEDGPEVITLSLWSGNGREGTMLSVIGQPTHDRLSIRLPKKSDEVVWGGGEQMSYLALNGRSFPMWTSEPGVGREPGTALTDKINADGSFAGGDYWCTNYPQPTFLTSSGLAGHLGDYDYSELDCRDDLSIDIHVWRFSTDLFFWVSDTPADHLTSWQSTFGSQPPLPDWAISGAIVGLKDGANSFARLEKIIAAGAVVSGLWCEDWVGIRQTSFGRRLFWDWQWNAARYPDLPAKIAELKARGIRFLGYVNPYLAVDGPQYAEAERLGYLALKLDRDEPYAVDFGEFDAGVVDFTNADAAEWFSEEIIGKQMLDFGLDGWMADFGEYLPVDLRLHDGDPMEEHNRWPVHWAKVNADAVASRGRTGDALFFMRAGFTGVQQYCPLLWAGDQSVDFSRHDGIGPSTPPRCRRVSSATPIAIAMSAGIPACMAISAPRN